MGIRLGLYTWCALSLGVVASVSGQEESEHRPVFSPDGAHVVLMRQGPHTDGDWELFIGDRSGKKTRRLTHSRGWDGYAVFSPDGVALVFDRSTDGSEGAKQPHVMEIASGETRRLGTYEGWLSVSDWSEVHGLLAFWERGGQRDLYLLDPAGAVVRRLTSTESLSEHDAHFSPDGENGDVFLVEPATGRVERLTEDPAWDHMPVWDPTGDRLLFTSYRSGTEKTYWFDLGSRTVKLWGEH